ncbi:alpha/beta hydrolase [Halomonas daqiaonensis]|uniref:Lysophospholipase, alpha-beta hydrolase superfamily n=1 Tax=Halomonas daqiaonensis TaxID=650850 RepID=A0A1H7KQS9_9GAMM|nr:alpha/beta hydrolase [Halomonas daqiaonensis]SEK88297.1 Lysophospholipase, alpha-beta hydrolase superfamily [Halomonas daqiaonensis]
MSALRTWIGGKVAITWWLAMVFATLGVLLLAGCGERAIRQSPGPGAEEARLAEGLVIAEDGYRLPLHHWPAEGDPQAIVLGIHGFNEYGGTFQLLAEALAPHGITLYAHDQRGFGSTAQRGIWPGHERLANDVSMLAELLSERHPETPLYLAGHSMGGAVAILALSGDNPPPVAGSVLISPAVWGFEAMPWYQRLSLWLGVRLFPGLSFSSRTVQNLGIEPTDDPEIKRRLAEDPLILHRARVDTLHGVSLAMDASLEAARRLPAPSLILYGTEDHIIPQEAICALLDRLPEDEAIRLVIYPQGYHMLTRYTQRERTEADIATWLADPTALLPSGHEQDRREARRALCDHFSG